MFKIDATGYAPGNLFTEGNPATGTLATRVSADWLNAVQGELVNMVEAAGLPLDKDNNFQLLQAITQLARMSYRWLYAPSNAYATRGSFLAGTYINMGLIPTIQGMIKESNVSSNAGGGQVESSLYSLVVNAAASCNVDVYCPNPDDEVLLYVNLTLVNTWTSGSSPTTPFSMALNAGVNTVEFLHRNTTNNSPGFICVNNWMAQSNIKWVRAGV